MICFQDSLGGVIYCKLELILGLQAVHKLDPKSWAALVCRELRCAVSLVVSSLETAGVSDSSR